ncbi:hypothetical protein EJ04DRAFT_451212 [Polyplosphaeria fusca]|uniref:Uncharacterized protein n=1 Tax=Polyplosphaeria fusca TaxID=682080 RepID=A0A9P4QMC5_9PLEO|nr:hypothetical protein EJ04DRAFT_451212 [Polyplosphaeria fusca]
MASNPRKKKTLPETSSIDNLSRTLAHQQPNYVCSDWLAGSDYQLGTQMDQAPILTEAFYANFLTYFTQSGERTELQNRQTWMHQLPYLSSDGTNVALSLAVRATAFAYCGVEMANLALFQESCKVYGQALNAHSRMIRLNKGKQVTVHMISTSVILSIYEAMRTTTADAYREHLYGAARMLEETGPGQCLHGVLCQLFFHIRTQMAFVYLTTQKGSEKRLDVKRILVENLEYEKLPMFQRLMGHVAALAEIYVKTITAGSKRQPSDLATYSNVQKQIDGLWLEYQNQAAKKGELLYWQEKGRMVFRNGMTALMIAYFCSARALFSVLAPRIADTYMDLSDHFGMILESAKYLRTPTIGCAYIRMATPLYLVALHSPLEEQRQDAKNAFHEWSRGSMAGVSGLALDAIAKRQEWLLNERSGLDAVAGQAGSMGNSSISPTIVGD